jgi:Uncharacterized conserved protein
LQHEPSGYAAALIFFLFVYSIKSMSYLVPIIVIYIAVGTLFPITAALIINLVGAAIVVTIPYWLGYYYGAGFLGTLFSRYPKIENFIKRQESNGWLVSCFPRTIVFVPVKSVSVYLGSLKVPFDKYLLGSITGLMPMLVSVTFLGRNITEPTSPEFIVAAIIIVISAWSSLAAYFLMERRRKKREGA